MELYHPAEEPNPDVVKVVQFILRRLLSLAGGRSVTPVEPRARRKRHLCKRRFSSWLASCQKSSPPEGSLIIRGSANFGPISARLTVSQGSCGRCGTRNSPLASNSDDKRLHRGTPADPCNANWEHPGCCRPCGSPARDHNAGRFRPFSRHWYSRGVGRIF
jgi:hypothetical protein